MGWFINRFRGLSVNNKVSIVLRVAFCFAALSLAFSGRPPANAQRPVVPVISNEDAAQDIAISKAQDFQHNQEGWNGQTGTQISELNMRVLALEKTTNNIDGTLKGGLGLLTALSTLALFFQLRKGKS